MPDVYSLTKQLGAESHAYISGDDLTASTQLDAWVSPEVPRIALPEVLSASPPFTDILRDRHAVRSYNTQPIDQRALSTLLRAATLGDGHDWPPEKNAARLEYLVVAWRVENTCPGIYLYEPNVHSLAMLTSAPDQETEGSGLVLQPEFAKASAIVLVIGGLATALAQHGARGHQILLLRAGAAAHRMWLASIAAGLEGTVFAGFLPRATQRLARVDGYYRAALFAYAMGVASDRTCN